MFFYLKEFLQLRITIEKMSYGDIVKGVIEVDMSMEIPKPTPIKPFREQLEELQQKYDKQSENLFDVEREKVRLSERYHNLLEEKNRLEVFLKNKGLYEECETYWAEKEREAEEQRHHQLELEREEREKREHEEELRKYCAYDDRSLEQQKASIERIREMMRASHGTKN